MTATATGTPTPCPTFTDVDIYNPFYVYIRCLSCRGLIGGYPDGTFRPYNNVTRGQAAKIIANSAGFTDIPTTQTFEDVPPTQVYYLWVERMAVRGYVSGYPCGGIGEPCVGPANRPYFRPYNNLTRGQLAKIASNAAGFTDTPVAGSQSFADVPPSDPFWIFIQRLARRGVVNGYECGSGTINPCTGLAETCGPGNLPYYRPCNNITRAQAVKVASNTFFPVNCAPGVPTIRQ
jgi:hypothetical protein